MSTTMMKPVDQAKPDPTPSMAIWDMLQGFLRARVVQTFAQLRIADAIAEGRDTPEALGGHAETMNRFLKASASVGLVKALENGRFALTETGEVLRSNVPGSMRALADVLVSGGHYGAWKNLTYSLETGDCAFDYTYGEDVWAHFTQTNPEEGKTFNEGMAGVSQAIIGAMLESYDFPAQGTICDVAGGNGGMLCAILAQRPELKGIVMDLPFSQPAAQAFIAGQGLADRCTPVPGNFFEEVPAGADLYTMKWILHDWNDEKSARILQTVHKAMPDHAKLLLIESVVPEGDDPAQTRLMDLHMLVMCGGKERTATEWAALLDANGFRMERIVPTPSPASVIEVVKK